MQVEPCRHPSDVALLIGRDERGGSVEVHRVGQLGHDLPPGHAEAELRRGGEHQHAHEGAGLLGEERVEEEDDEAAAGREQLGEALEGMAATGLTGTHTLNQVHTESGNPGCVVTLRVEFDWDTKTVDLFIDGVLRGNDVPFRSGANDEANRELCRGTKAMNRREFDAAIEHFADCVATNTEPISAGRIAVGDLAVAMPDNLVHGSDSSESAEREIALWFPDEAL